MRRNLLAKYILKIPFLKMLKKLSTLIFPTFKRKEGIEKQMHKYGRELTNKTLLLEKEYYTVFGTNGSKDIKNHLN